jgi:hypothetical protein
MGPPKAPVRQSSKVAILPDFASGTSSSFRPFAILWDEPLAVSKIRPQAANREAFHYGRSKFERHRNWPQATKLMAIFLSFVLVAD